MNDYPNLSEFTILVIKAIKSIPEGKVATYGQIAKYCGKANGARQVSRILHSCSKKYNMPWHRVINSKGKISLSGENGEIQYQLLKEESIAINSKYEIDLRKHQVSL